MFIGTIELYPLNFTMGQAREKRIRIILKVNQDTNEKIKPNRTPVCSLTCFVTLRKIMVWSR